MLAARLSSNLSLDEDGLHRAISPMTYLMSP
jgi:hypothetical protein